MMMSGVREMESEKEGGDVLAGTWLSHRCVGPWSTHCNQLEWVSVQRLCASGSLSGSKPGYSPDSMNL